MVVVTQSARVAAREGSMSPPTYPRGPQGISMPDNGLEGVCPPPPPPIHLGQGDPTSPRPGPPSPHSSDGRTLGAHSPFTRPWRQRPRKAPNTSSDAQPSTSQPRRGGRDCLRLPSISNPYVTQADLHRMVSAVVERMRVPLDNMHFIHEFT